MVGRQAQTMPMAGSMMDQIQQGVMSSDKREQVRSDAVFENVVTAIHTVPKKSGLKEKLGTYE
jgi:hypothetical protein